MRPHITKQPGFRASSSKTISRFSNRVYRSGPAIASVIDSTEKVTNIASFIQNLMPSHGSTETHAAANSTPTTTTTSIAAVTPTPSPAATAIATPPPHHHSSMFSELDLRTLPTAPKTIHVIEVVGGKERAFIAEIVIKEEVSLDDIVVDEQVLEDVNADDLHLHT